MKKEKYDYVSPDSSVINICVKRLVCQSGIVDDDDINLDIEDAAWSDLDW